MAGHREVGHRGSGPFRALRYPTNRQPVASSGTIDNTEPCQCFHLRHRFSVAPWTDGKNLLTERRSLRCQGRTVALRIRATVRPSHPPTTTSRSSATGSLRTSVDDDAEIWRESPVTCLDVVAVAGSKVSFLFFFPSESSSRTPVLMFAEVCRRGEESLSGITARGVSAAAARVCKELATESSLECNHEKNSTPAFCRCFCFRDEATIVEDSIVAVPEPRGRISTLWSREFLMTVPHFTFFGVILMVGDFRIVCV